MADEADERSRVPVAATLLAVAGRVRSPLAKAGLVALLCLLAGALFGVFRMDPAVENTWTGYHYGDTGRRFDNINLPTQLGAAGAILDNRDHKTVRALENHSETQYFDDVGYVLLPQLYVLAFGPITPEGMLTFHNTLFCLSLISIAALLTLATNSAVAGLLAYALFLPMHRLFAGFVYHTASQPAIVVPMVALAVACLMALSITISRTRNRWPSIVAAVLVGGVFGLIMLTRYPIGTGAVLAAYIAALLMGRTWKRRIGLVAIIWAGFWTMQSGMPGLVEMHRDAKLEWKRESVLSYFRGPPNHEPWFALLASVGRYENALGVELIDSSVDKLLVARKAAEPNRWPLSYDKIFDKIARDVLMEYIQQHPGEFIGHRVQGALELFSVIPGVTFMSNDLFGGSPYVSPAKAAIVNPRDLRRDTNQMINVHFAYLDLSLVQWVAYVLAFTSVIGACVFAVMNWNRKRDPARIMAALVALWGLYAVSRALIPWYGQDFVFMFWVISAIGGGWLGSELIGMLWQGFAGRKQVGNAALAIDEAAA